MPAKYLVSNNGTFWISLLEVRLVNVVNIADGPEDPDGKWICLREMRSAYAIQSFAGTNR